MWEAHIHGCGYEFCEQIGSISSCDYNSPIVDAWCAQWYTVHEHLFDDILMLIPINKLPVLNCYFDFSF